MHELELATDKIFYGNEGDFVKSENGLTCVTRCNSGRQNVLPICLIRHDGFAYVETKKAVIIDWIKVVAGNQNIRIFKFDDGIPVPATSEEEAKERFQKNKVHY